MYELRIAARHVKARGRQTSFTIIAVALTVILISTTVAMMSGIQKELIKKTVEKNPHVIIEPREKEDYIYLHKTLVSYVSSLSHVEGVSPRFREEAAIEYKDKAQGINLIGIDPESEDKVLGIAAQIVEGNILTLAHTSNTIVIGDKLASKLDLKAGDIASLSYPEKSRSVRVVGIFHTGTEKDETLVYTSLYTAQNFYGETDAVNEITVRVDDIYRAEEIASQIRKSNDYKVTSWIEASHDLLVLLETQSNYILIFYALVFVISGFGIVNLLIMIVSGKIREIGMLMAMGATKRSIALIFLIESVIFGTIGIAIGSIAAYIIEVLIQQYPISIPEEIYFGMTSIPIEINIDSFLISAVFALLMSIVAGVYPAWQASKLDPVEAIRVV